MHDFTDCYAGNVFNFDLNLSFASKVSTATTNLFIYLFIYTNY